MIRSKSFHQSLQGLLGPHVRAAVDEEGCWLCVMYAVVSENEIEDPQEQSENIFMIISIEYPYSIKTIQILV